jgi:hypothetical protein
MVLEYLKSRERLNGPNLRSGPARATKELG